MAKNAGKTDRHITTLGFNPEIYGAGLAHVIKVENTEQGRRETVLGQAWLAGVGKLVTCGHVVEPHLSNPGSLVVTFPYSGNRYPISLIKLHPSFVKQPDGLVKFDAALLIVQLNEPELSARVLPIVYEKPLPAQSPLMAVRYPVHLGQYSSALNPLAQTGHLLGPLRKHDDFHLLHDTALAPGDSGAPIFDNETLVALHCGDTATLPGLNLPTTSIRLALWVDALRELGVEGVLAETPGHRAARLNPAALVVAFWVVFFLSLAGLCVFRAYPTLAKHRGETSAIRPITVRFNKPRDQYKYGDSATISVFPKSKCYVYLYAEDEKDHYIRIFPTFKAGGEVDRNYYTLDEGKSAEMGLVGDGELNVDCNPMKFHLIALNFGLKPLDIGPSYEQHVAQRAKIKETTSEIMKARELLKDNPNEIVEITFDSPVATKESYEEYRKAHGGAAVQSQSPSQSSGSTDQGNTNKGQDAQTTGQGAGSDQAKADTTTQTSQ